MIVRLENSEIREAIEAHVANRFDGTGLEITHLEFIATPVKHGGVRAEVTLELGPVDREDDDS